MSMPRPLCPDCRVYLQWAAPPDTPAFLKAWVGGPYTCPECRQEFDVHYTSSAIATPKGPPKRFGRSHAE